MSAQAWKIFNKAKHKLGTGALLLNGTHYRMTLHTSASNFATVTLSAYGSLTNELTEANGYSSSGKALTSAAWTQGASAKQQKFDVGDVFWSANGGSISNIKGAVIWVSAATTTGRHIICSASLTSSQFALASGNRLTVTINASGVFTLT
jgi:hypothetical protein